MYFVCGVQGVGKTLFSNNMSKIKSIRCYSASQLIKSKANKVISDYKKARQISNNQELLLQAIEEIKELQYILDGHLCLINGYNRIERIPIEVFEKMNIDVIYIIVDDPLKIQSRLKNRDEQRRTTRFIASFQQEEFNYARDLAEIKSIPLKIIYNNKEIEEYPSFEKDNIILPIKPIFVKKIICGEKKYEYRKKLCRKDINKIYIYATVPIKKIIGEAKVINKLKMDKEELWKQTHVYSGISKEFYDKYFEKQDYACAYQIGEIKQYDNPITLDSIGIKNVPQAFVYYGDLKML